MGEGLPEELIEKLMPALNELAELIGDGIEPDNDATIGILSKVGLGENRKAFDVFERCSELLRRCNNISDDTEQKERIVAALQEIGIPEAPATLAVERAIPKPPPELEIDFGTLRPGETAHRTLKLSGWFSGAEWRDKRLDVTLFRPRSTETSLRIMLKAGQAGESLSDEVVLQGRRREIRVPVTAHWAVAREPVMPKEPQGPQPLKVCLICKEKSLFWNWRDKTWGCLNLKCPDYYGTKESRRPR